MSAGGRSGFDAGHAAAAISPGFPLSGLSVRSLHDSNLPRCEIVGFRAGFRISLGHVVIGGDKRGRAVGGVSVATFAILGLEIPCQTTMRLQPRHSERSEEPLISGFPHRRNVRCHQEVRGPSLDDGIGEHALQGAACLTRGIFVSRTFLASLGEELPMPGCDTLHVGRNLRFRGT